MREIECVVHDRTADWKYRQDMLLSVVKTKEGKWTVNPEEIILLGMEEVE
ncbi:hypothetical protein FHS18_002871 [Paenibacillus phyllosphaerae]|uniref:Uncharacterized protein n=1 Tax=Paenibacillus phyllosphaerae TaxID=274593 RepID=A0A7W5FN95_9BACL|nr:hypothetical protein [Paenibacillus phyllosphaerae]MBB3110804.1 hypothetical protein [Paenibacillus phyllosphaerae]